MASESKRRCGPIERLGRHRQALAQELAHAGERAAQLFDGVLLAEHVADAPGRVEGARGVVQHLVSQQLEIARRGVGCVAGRLARLLLVRRDAHQHRHQLRPGGAVDHAVVDLRDRREAVAPLESLDEPDLPERSLAVERLRDDAAGEPLELLDVSGAGQGGVAHVEVDAEEGIVHPDGAARERRGADALAVQVQARRDEASDAADVDAALLRVEGLRVGDEHGCDVHGRVRPLAAEERRILGGQTVVAVAGHGTPSLPLCRLGRLGSADTWRKAQHTRIPRRGSPRPG
jgi:hypothetical protein